MSKMKAIDVVIAVAKALRDWDRSPKQVAEKLGAAIEAVRQFKPAESLPRAEASDIADSCFEAAHAMPRPEAIHFISGLIATNRKSYATDCDKGQAKADWQLDDAQLSREILKTVGITGDGRAFGELLIDVVCVIKKHRPAPTADLRIPIAESVRQDMLNILPRDVADKLKNAHIMDVWMVVHNHLTNTAPTAEKALELIKDIAKFGDPEGRRGEAIANVVYWGNKARALLAHEAPMDDTARNKDGTPYHGVSDTIAHEAPKEGEHA